MATATMRQLPTAGLSGVLAPRKASSDVARITRAKEIGAATSQSRGIRLAERVALWSSARNGGIRTVELVRVPPAWKCALRGLALARIKSLKVPLSTHDEQVDIARALDLAGCKAENARAKRNQLQDLFRTLLHELMTAKTRVHELEITA